MNLLPLHFKSMVILFNPNITLKLNNASKLDIPNYLLQNPRKPSSLSSFHLYSPMRLRWVNGNAYGSDFSYRKMVPTRHQSDSKFVVRSSVKSSQSQVPSNSNGRIIFWSAVTLVLAIGNRVLYKLALVPMKEYPFFLAQVNTFGYFFFLCYRRIPNISQSGCKCYLLFNVGMWRFIFLYCI